MIPISDPPFPNYKGGPIQWGRIKLSPVLAFLLARSSVGHEHNRSTDIFSLYGTILNTVLVCTEPYTLYVLKKLSFENML